MNLLTVLILLALGATIASLSLGLYSMERGGEYDRFHSTRYMVARVATPSGEIVATLAGLNIHTDETRFREMASAHGSPDALADVWEAGSTATDIWEDYVWMAAVTLWERWTPDLFCVDLFVDRHLPLDAFRDDAPANREEAERHWAMAQAVMDLVAPRAGEPRLDLLDELTERSTVEVGWWLGELPFALARFGMVDEEAELCARMASVREVEHFLGDRAVILAEAGRRDEALRQVEPATPIATRPDALVAFARVKGEHE